MKRILTLLLPLTCLFADPEPSYEEAIKSFITEFLGNFLDNKNDCLSTTSHEIQLPNGPLAYTAIAGTLPQFTDKG